MGLVQLGFINPVCGFGKLFQHFIVEVAVRAYARLYVCDWTVLKAAMYLAVNSDGCCAFKLIQHSVGNQFSDFCFRVRHRLEVG